jgi:hypothetical protein
MKNLRSLGIAAAILLAVGVADARAGLITLVNGPVALQTPAGGVNPNDVIPGLWGYIGADIALTGVAGTSYLVTFTLIGSESGYTNTLVAGGNSLTENNGITGPFIQAPQSISYIQVATGGFDLLQFMFTTPGLFDLVNGSNGGFGIGDPRTFYASFCSVGTPIAIPVGGCNFSGNATTGDAAWLALDDSGAGPDDNHDDWVGIVSVTPVTVPDGGSALALLGAALTGLGMLRRRLS